MSDEEPATQAAGPEHVVDADADGDRVRAPWHFWLMIGIVAVYLGWRLVQGMFWAASNWF